MARFSFAPGQVLGKYRLLGEVGRGGMAIVYKAMDMTSGSQVALKVLPPQLALDTELVQRFLRETRTAGRLRHPHIAVVYEAGEAGGIYYIAMQYLEGQTLKALLLHQGSLPPEVAAGILRQAAAALDYAHSQGVVHRDVKSSNIMIGPGGHVALTDFGIARMATDRTLTHSGMIIGTPEYMSPEQAQGERVTPQSDVYSLGIVLYEMLTGRVPFSGPTHAVLLAHLTRLPSPPRSLKPVLTPAVEATVLRALAKVPGERYRSAGEMAQALEAACRWQSGQPIEPLPSSLSGRTVAPSMAEARRAPPGGPLPIGMGQNQALWAVLVGGALVFVLLVAVLLANPQPPDGRGTLPGLPTPTISILRAGRYPQGKVHTRTLPQGVEKTFTLDTVEVLTDGTLRFEVRMGVRIAPGSAVTSVVKHSDVGNRDMYLTDAQGNHYDHTQAGGDFARELSLTNGQTISGWFFFPPPKSGARVFTFHVDDEGFRLTDIVVGQ